MMTNPEKPSGNDEICPMCGKSKNKHTEKEMVVCARKMEEFKKQKDGGAGIQ